MTRRTRPDTVQAMRLLIQRIRTAVPLDLRADALCRDGCNACSLKLVEFLAGELESWEAALEAGARPGLAELSRLENTARKVHRALVRNGVIPPPAENGGPEV